MWKRSTATRWTSGRRRTEPNKTDFFFTGPPTSRVPRLNLVWVGPSRVERVDGP